MLLCGDDNKMIQKDRRRFLIEYLLKENIQDSKIDIPTGETEQKRLLRALFNIRMPKPISDEFLSIQDDYLQEEAKLKGIIDYKSLKPTEKGFYIWKGDITKLKCDAIVNAANSQMLGCFYPNHGCIDNAIHTCAGVQLRLACAEIMKSQGCEEKTGKAKITPAFNLPCRYVIHTVGPIVRGCLTTEDCELLASCYRSCLELADKNGLKSIAFCCISTGEFHFPNNKAAEIAIETVSNYKEQTNSKIEVIYNVFKEVDYRIYTELLRAN